MEEALANADSRANLETKLILVNVFFWSKLFWVYHVPTPQAKFS